VAKVVLPVHLNLLRAKLLMVVCVHLTVIAFQTFAVVLNVVALKVNQKDAQVVVKTVVVVYAARISF